MAPTTSATLNNRKAKTQSKSAQVVEEDQVEKFIVPNLTVKDLLSAIPPHCFQRNFWRSMTYVIWDFALLGAFLWTALTYIPKINADNLSLPHPALYKVARFAAWGFYDLAAGLVATGLWVIAHECGHQAFSTSKTANNTVGWILHSALGVPYHSWRITHAKHHAQTSHLTGDQVFVPKTRSERGLPARNPEKENLEGSKVSIDVQEELWEALGDAPLAPIVWLTAQFALGWPLYIITNATGQRNYPRFTNHFLPKAPLFAPHQYMGVLQSDFGIVLWLIAVVYSIKTFGFLNVFRIYLMPYLWVNHWLVFITFLQHTDPALPHYAPTSFTFPRGALSTFDRQLMGGPGIFGAITGFICGTATHGISETHVAHHIASKIPHYNAWEAKAALEKRLAQEGISIQGNPGTWSEAYKIFTQCKFIEDEGEVRFYKNAYGKAARVPVFQSESVSDSGVDMQ
jgi:omega-6 fatty acid desaturase (delta-12 desaturase)